MNFVREILCCRLAASDFAYKILCRRLTARNFSRKIVITRLQRGIYRGRLPVAERRPLLISIKDMQPANWLKSL
ncbi:hypothetical protein CLI81_01320 [Porphyromonas gingivalis]|nr:hypothetical protein CLI81_01320 [Porphyromonas gingivalis]